VVELHSIFNAGVNLMEAKIMVYSERDETMNGTDTKANFDVVSVLFGPFTKLLKATISFVMSVRLYA
jgi:hypothetical protein